MWPGAGAAWASWAWWSVSRDVSDAAGPCRRGGTGSRGAAARARGLGFRAQCLCLRRVPVLVLVSGHQELFSALQGE